MIELIIVAAIIGVTFFALAELQVALLKSKTDSINKTRATYYAIEAIEAVRRVRDDTSRGWPTIQTYTTGGGTLYYPIISATTGDWDLTTTSNTPDSGFTWSLAFYNVNRDTIPGSGAIVTGSGSPDDDTRRAVATVSWGTPLQKVSIETYLIKPVWKSVL